MSEQPRNAPLSAWYALVVLTAVLLFATVDRAILSLLAEPLKNSLGLSDLQLGLMQGTGIAVFAALAAYPMGWLSDRFGRQRVLCASIVIWSLAVVGCALAQNFTQMFIATSMVGAGEAGLAPITFALIADVFQRRQRQLANSVFILASAAGGGLGMVISGQLVNIVVATRDVLPAGLESLEDWRVAFLYAAAPAPLMVLLVMTIRATRSSGFVGVADPGLRHATDASAPSFIAHCRQHSHVLLPFFGGMGFAMFAFAAVGAWMPVILTRLFGQTPAQIGGALGSISLIGMMGGFLFSAWGMRLLEARLGARLQIRAMAWAAGLCVITSLSLTLASSAIQVYAIQAIQVLCLTAANMLYPTVLQNLAPAPLRARLVSVQIVVSTAAGALGPPIVGFASDRIAGPTGILIAGGGVASVGLLFSAVLFRRCEKEGYVDSVEAIARVDGEAVGIPAMRPA